MDKATLALAAGTVAMIALCFVMMLDQLCI